MWQANLLAIFALDCQSYHIIIGPKFGNYFYLGVYFPGRQRWHGIVEQRRVDPIVVSKPDGALHTYLVTFVKVFLSSEPHSLKEPTTRKEMCSRKPRLLFLWVIYAPQAKYIYFALFTRCGVTDNSLAYLCWNGHKAREGKGSIPKKNF